MKNLKGIKKLRYKRIGLKNSMETYSRYEKIKV